MKLLTSIIAFLATVASAHAVIYTVKAQTSTEAFAGSDNIHVNLYLHGHSGEVDLGGLDTSGDDFEGGATNVFVIESDAYINFNCIRLVAEADDAWLFDYISISSDINPKERLFNNTDGIWMSKDSSEGSATITLCIDPVTYSITTHTSLSSFAGSNFIGLQATLTGDAGEVKFQNFPGFDTGATQEFKFVLDTDIGNLQCLTLRATADDAWLFDSIEIRVDDRDEWIVRNGITWMSSDLDEGKNQLKFCRA